MMHAIPRPADADNDGIADADEAAMGTTGTDTDSGQVVHAAATYLFFK